MGYMEQIKTLVNMCDADEQEMVEEMIFNAAEYVKAVVVMETTTKNLTERETQDYRDAVMSTDRSRTVIHNALITAVNVVNRICANYDQPFLYDGDNERRHYGDFAFALTGEIFQARK